MNYINTLPIWIKKEIAKIGKLLQTGNDNRRMAENVERGCLQGGLQDEVIERWDCCIYVWAYKNIISFLKLSVCVDYINKKLKQH